jgi:dihydrofolate reductase
MRKIVVEAEVSLDGVLGGESPDFWAQAFNYHGPDLTEYLKKVLFAPDSLLMGRKTYEFFADVWPKRDGEDADRINGMPKFVASRTLQAPLAWNATLIEGNPAEEIGKMKQQPGGELLQYGVGELTRTMLQHGLVDELRLVVYPFTVGRGPRVFENFDPAGLKLLSSQPFSTGAIALHYEPGRD